MIRITLPLKKMEAEEIKKAAEKAWDTGMNLLALDLYEVYLDKEGLA